jgi:oligopeptide transport system substrate-binding protein
LDEHTLQVTLEKPVPYFLLKLTYPTSYIVDKENVEKSKTWYKAPNGTGPFRLTRWDPRESILYERFDAFYGEKPKLKAIRIIMYQGTSLQLYEQGMIDTTGISYSDLTRFTDPTEPMHDQLNSNTNMCTSYITIDVTQPPFDDVRVRQAFAMTIDKDEYVKVISDGGELPARGLYPPALPGYDKYFRGLEFDPQKARELLKTSKYGNDDLPPIIFSISGYGNSVPNGISAVAQMWEENLGVKVTIQNIDPEYYETVLDSGKHGQLISQGWCADYPDPENFADVLFHTDREMNRGNYSNPGLDLLLEFARIESDVSKRMEMYRMAEKIIVNDVPAIFWTHSNSYVLVKPYLQGYVGAPIDIPLEKYMWIDGNKFIP